MGNRHFDGELWTVDSFLFQKIGNRGGCMSCEGGKDEYSDEDVGFLLSTVELTRI